MNILGATGLTMIGLGLLRLARHSTHPSVMWLGAATSFIGAYTMLRHGREQTEHEAEFERIEVE